MRTVKTLIFFSILLSISIIFYCCKNNDNPKLPGSISTEKQSQEQSSNNIDRLIVTENTFGKLNLKSGMSLDELKLKQLFDNLTVSKYVGEQDGPNYFYYKIGAQAIIATPNTENEILSQLQIIEKSKVSDEYGIELGMTYIDIAKKRPNMNISTAHYHIYLDQQGSNIGYEMSLGNYNGPDKKAYSLDDITNSHSKVIAIIWK